MRVQIRELKKKNMELTNEVAALKHAAGYDASHATGYDTGYAASHAIGQAIVQGQKEVLERLLKVMQPIQNE